MNMMKKQGEQEAKIILEKIGLTFHSTYCDDNSKTSMPDLKCTDNTFIEVTHTHHNNSIVKAQNQFFKKDVKEQLKISEQANESYERLKLGAYEKNSNGKLTEMSEKNYLKDLEICKNHFGMHDGHKSSELKCNMPVICSSVDNIVDKIVNDKGKKHANGNTDLFIFVLENEYKHLLELIGEKGWNGAYHTFEKQILAAPFKTIYICMWDFDNQKYLTEKSELLILKKDSMKLKISKKYY